MRLFKRRRTKLYSFHTGTVGMSKHSKFIKMVDEKGWKIIHAYTEFNSYEHSHKPMYLNYVVSYKE